MNMHRGRPKRGESDAKERLLAEATRQFLAGGYRATTLRSVAAACHVDVALISYHFTSKRGLFAAAVRVPASPTDVVEAAVHDGTLDPRRLLRAVIRAWDDPHTGRPLHALAQAAMVDPAQQTAMREYLGHELITAIAHHLRGPQRERRARAAVYVIAGAVLGHYLLGLDRHADPERLFADLIVPLTAALQPPRVAR